MQTSLQLPPEKTISQEEYDKLQAAIDRARTFVHEAEHELRLAEAKHIVAKKTFYDACMAMPSVIKHTDTGVIEIQTA